MISGLLMSCHPVLSLLEMSSENICDAIDDGTFDHPYYNHEDFGEEHTCLIMNADAENVYFADAENNDLTDAENNHLTDAENNDYAVKDMDSEACNEFSQMRLHRKAKGVSEALQTVQCLD